MKFWVDTEEGKRTDYWYKLSVEEGIVIVNAYRGRFLCFKMKRKYIYSAKTIPIHQHKTAFDKIAAAHQWILNQLRDRHNKDMAEQEETKELNIAIRHKRSNVMAIGKLSNFGKEIND